MSVITFHLALYSFYHAHLSILPLNSTFQFSKKRLPSSKRGLLQKKKREKNGIWHVEIGKNFAENDMTKNFIKHNPNYSSGDIKSQKISEIGP